MNTARCFPKQCEVKALFCFLIWKGSGVSVSQGSWKTRRRSWLLVAAIYGASNLWTKSLPVFPVVYRTRRPAAARLIKSDLFSFAYLLNWCPPRPPPPDSHNFIIQTIRRGLINADEGWGPPLVNMLLHIKNRASSSVLINNHLQSEKTENNLWLQRHFRYISSFNHHYAGI